MPVGQRNHIHHLSREKLLMSVPLFSLKDSVSSVRHSIEKRHDWDSVTYVYVQDRESRLKGVVSIKELLRAPLDVTLGSLCKRDLVTVRERSSPERVAVIAIHHGIKSVPVVDHRGKLIGVVGTDEIMSILQRSGIEDAIRYSGIHLEHRGLLDVLRGRIGFLVWRRLPWLLVGLGGGMAASVFVGRFEGILREVVELAFFTPAIVYMGAAVGSQTQALFLRAITIGEVRVSKFVAKEIVIDALLGIVIGVLSAGCTFFMLNDVLLASIVGISMFGAVLMSGVVAILMALLLSGRRRDPALGAGPFATIVQDIVSLFVYFSVATFFIRQFGMS